jgi:N-methylhydantoinase B
VYGSQVEVTESTAPLLVRRRELRPDSGGPGKYRGGLGQIIEIASSEDAPFFLFASVDRMKYPARGCFGGLDAACGHIALASGKVLKGKGKQEVPAGETLIFQTPGGAGYGEPFTRPVENVVKDFNAGLISKESVNKDYGVELTNKGVADIRSTKSYRKQNCPSR